MSRALVAGLWLEPWAVFEAGASLSLCQMYFSAGTFTADIYIDAEPDPSFTITQADTSGVGLLSGKTGVSAGDIMIVRCNITASSNDLDGLFIYLT
jgi:hypothetical protein